jgi:tellurite methyltransferase
MRTGGGYDDGYSLCPCFWGTSPASMLLRLESIVGSLDGKRVLDVGCGEGKNAAFCAARGAAIVAIDISDIAIRRARSLWAGVEAIEWMVSDIRELEMADSEFDLVIAYGIFHCLPSEWEIRHTVDRLQGSTRVGGYHVVCAMNDRFQELGAHPDLEPCLIPHQLYLSFYQQWEIVSASDADLQETHPHNCIPHRHSMTRLIARKH